MSWIIFDSVVKLIPSIRQATIMNDLIAASFFLSFSCTISSTLLIVYRIYDSLSNQNNHSKKRFIHIVDALVQSTAAYALALLVAAIALVILATSKDSPTLSINTVLTYEGISILFFVSVRTFGIQILVKFNIF